jgi:hypothetical protein
MKNTHDKEITIFKELKKAALIALVLALLISNCAFAASEVVTRAIDLISTMESSGNYASVANDTNGSPSVGILQWNNTRAVDLLKKIIAADPDAAKALLGEALCQEIEACGADGWGEKALDDAQKKAISALMKTTIGKQMQVEQAHADVAYYINRARSQGIVDANALVYYADIAHQAGVGGVRKYAAKAAEVRGGYHKITLKSMYDAALEISTSFKTRRKRVYQALGKSPVRDEGAAPESVRISPAGDKIIGLEDTLMLTALLDPADSVTRITWASSDPEVVAVDGGMIRPMQLGTAVITAETAEGQTDSILITVLAVAPTASPTPDPAASPAPDSGVSPTPDPSVSPTPDSSVSPTPDSSVSPTPDSSVSPAPDATAKP